MKPNGHHLPTLPRNQWVSRDHHEKVLERLQEAETMLKRMRRKCCELEEILATERQIYARRGW